MDHGIQNAESVNDVVWRTRVRRRYYARASVVRLRWERARESLSRSLVNLTRIVLIYVAEKQRRDSPSR